MGYLTQLCFILVVILVAFSLESEARKPGKEKRLNKKFGYNHQALRKHDGFHKSKKGPNFPGYPKKSPGFSKEKSKYDVELYDMKKYSKYGMDQVGSEEKVKSKKGKFMTKKQKVKMMKKQKNKDLGWMKFKPDAECIPQCKRNERCISGPIDSKAFCVKRRDLKKSVKLFHRYQKKEMKQWKKFKKEHYNDIHSEDKYWKDEKKNDDLKLKDKHAMKKYDFDSKMDKKAKKHLKKGHAASFVEDDDENECTTTDFGEMRTRMMGWFHVLHGQDHLMKKEKKGSLKHFHKHVSVKKELREHEGQSCQCFKSAMWQFHEMDDNKNNVLDEKELMLVAENSLEPCVKPYLNSCDRNADGVLSDNEWCCCFSSVVAPCFQKLDEIRKSGDKLAYVPRCDKEGYYMREQCQGDANNENDNYGCWCVDYNGNEYKGTFTKGRAHCSKIALRALDKTPMI